MHFGIGNITHPLQNKIADPIQRTASDVKDKAADVATDVKKTADTAVSGAKGAFGKVKNFAKNVGNFLKNIFGSIWNFLKNLSGYVKIILYVLLCCCICSFIAPLLIPGFAITSVVSKIL